MRNNLEVVKFCLACNSSELTVLMSTKTMMAPQIDDWSFMSCSDCQHVILSPRVIPADLEHFYTESYLPYRGPEAWGKFGDIVSLDLDKIDMKRVKTLQRYVQGDSIRVLDIGCGKPTFLAKLKGKGNYQCIGIDFSNHGWNGDASFINLELNVGEPQNTVLPVKVDVITMWHYLEHDYNPRKTLENLLLSSHKDTHLIIEVPNHDSYSRRKFGQFWAGYHTPRHTSLFTIENLTRLLKESGWELVDSYEYGTLDPYTLDWMSRMEQKGIDWSSNMETRFWTYVFGKIRRPIYYFEKWKSLGFMTVVAKPCTP